MHARAQGFSRKLPSVRKRLKALRQLILECLENRTLPTGGYTQISLVDPNFTGVYDKPPEASSLPNGNIVVGASDESIGRVAGAGGVYFYSGSNGAKATSECQACYLGPIAWSTARCSIVLARPRESVRSAQVLWR
jgi:hypothetical protein